MDRRALVGLALVAAVIGCRRADAGDDAPAVLFGRAHFMDASPTQVERGSVRFILRGVGDISDNCPDARRRRFVAEYNGTLVVSPDGSFEAHLMPFVPAVATLSGCTVTRVVIERIDTITLTAALPALDLEGFGWLDYQTLTSTDNDRLQSGAFEKLRATLVFVRTGYLPMPR